MLYDNVNLHYTADTARNTGTRFHLSMNYKVGYDEIPNLKWAAPLLNNAYSPDNSDIYDFKSKMMKYGGHVHSWCNDGEWYVNILGESEYLDSIMTLVSRLLIAPRFNKDDMISVSRVASHMMQQESNNQYVVSNAAMEKVMYGENSLYIDRPSPESMYSWKFVEGTVVESFLPGTEISKALFDATGYALDIHYSGPDSIERVMQAITKTPVHERVKDPVDTYREPQKYDKTSVVYCSVENMENVQVQFYLTSAPYDTANDVTVIALNMYLSRLFVRECRDRSLSAENAYIYISQPKAGQDMYLRGSVMVPAVNVLGAIDVFSELMGDMPYRQDDFRRIKDDLNYAYTARREPSIRTKSMKSYHKKYFNQGFPLPSAAIIEKIGSVTYVDIRRYYDDNIQGRPFVIVITGKSKEIDFKAIKAKYGSVKSVSPSSLFR